jgi:hypothetical protein
VIIHYAASTDLSRNGRVAKPIARLRRREDHRAGVLAGGLPPPNGVKIGGGREVVAAAS